MTKVVRCSAGCLYTALHGHSRSGRPGRALPTSRTALIRISGRTRSMPNLAPFARRGRATGQRTYCPCSVCSEPEAHPLQAVRGLAAALSHANATGNPGGLRFARRLGRSPLDGHCGPAALVGSIHVAVARKCSRSFGYQQAAQFVKAPDLLGLGEQEPVIIYRNRVVTASTSPRPTCCQRDTGSLPR